MSNERYELRRMPLARGVMGEVWQGRDLRRHRDVAVKFPRVPAGADRDEMVRCFRSEVHAMASVRHPGVPTVFDSGTDNGRPYLVMRLVRGRSLSDVLAEEGRLPACRVADIGARVCAALAAVHDAGLVHGDVKPANLMLEPDGTVVLVDFGLATVEGRPLIVPQHVPDLPPLKAPELEFGADATRAGDLYALGRTLRELLTDRSTGSAAQGDVPAAFAAALDGLSAADPRARPASAAAAGRELQGPGVRTSHPSGVPTAEASLPVAV